jgi:hypothetical protein
MEEKDDEDGTSKHCNKEEKPQTSSPLLLLQLPLPKKNDERQIVQTSIISAHNSKKWSF